MSGGHPERGERALDFSPKEKAGAWDKAGGRGRCRRVLEGRVGY